MSDAGADDGGGGGGGVHGIGIYLCGMNEHGGGDAQHSVVSAPAVKCGK